MPGFGGTGIDIAGVNIGLREGVLLLIVLVAFYIGRVLWRMRNIAAGAANRQAPQKSSPPAAAEPMPALSREATGPGVEDAPYLRPFDTRDAEGVMPAVPDTAGLEREVALLRDEVDILRGELAALRNDMQHELAQVRVAQNVSPLYGDAMQMALAGHTAEMIAERCGIARAEAELVVALTQSQAAAQTH